MPDQPAFPQYDTHAISGEITGIVGGLTKREWYAGMALMGIAANPRSYHDEGFHYALMADEARRMADAMLDQEAGRE